MHVQSCCVANRANKLVFGVVIVIVVVVAQAPY